MGPICHPLCTIKVAFLGLFFAPDIWSLSFFFRSHAASEKLSKVLAHGTRMSSSMYNKVSFLRFFYPLIFGHLPFSFDHMPPLKLRSQVAHGSHMSASMNNKPFLCWIYFLPLISGYLPFSFDPLPPLKRCWQVGPTCHPL